MGSQAQLDLAAVDPAVWFIQAGGADYGPYTLGQMTSFAEEGRLARRSPVRKGREGAFTPAEKIPELGQALMAIPRPKPAQPAGEPANYLVVARTVAEDADAPEADLAGALNDLGRFAEAAPGVFILRSAVRLAKLRQRLAEAAGGEDRIIVVDATRNRIAWVNLGQDVDVHLRQVWDGPLAAEPGA